MSNCKKARLLIETKDQKGLIYKVSKILFEYKLNIEQNSEFVDKEQDKFFMRTIINGSFDKEKLTNDIKKILPKKHVLKINYPENKNIVLMVTKESHVLGDILIKYASKELDANIKAVVSNYKDLDKIVSKFNIPYHTVSANSLSREEHEKKLMKVINPYNPDIIVMAKYMRILTENFVKCYRGKMLNIHHSFLPAFIGSNPYKQAYDRGVKIIGATAHFITNDLDEGPIIYQDITRVNHSYSWRDMKDEGKNIEKIVLSNALQLLLDDKVFVYSNKTVIL